MFANKFYKIFLADNTFTQPYNENLCTRLRNIFIFWCVCTWKACKANILHLPSLYSVHTGIGISNSKTLLLKLDIVSKPKPQNNQKMSNGGHTNHLIIYQWQKVQSIKENVIEVKSLDSISEGNGWTRYWRAVVNTYIDGMS